MSEPTGHMTVLVTVLFTVNWAANQSSPRADHMLRDRRTDLINRRGLIADLEDEPGPLSGRNEHPS